MAATEVKLPEIGEGVTEGELIKWLVKAGDAVKVDQPLAEIMTDKATVEVPSTVAGTVTELKAKEGEVIQVGKTMLVLETTGTKSASPAPVAQSAPVAPASKPMAPVPTMSASAVSASTSTSSSMTVHPPVADSRVLASPSTRRLAREMNVDINSLRGTGVANRVTREDVLGNGGQGSGAVAGGAPSFEIPRPKYQGVGGELEVREPLRGIRKKIAEKMQMSKHVVPHFTLMDEANVSGLVKIREDVKAQAEKQGVKVTYLPFVMKALIATMREFPMFNASIDDEGQAIVYKKYFNIGFAADTPQGLVVPVIKNADQKTIFEISKEILELSQKARAGKLSPDDMKGATISITNIGSVGGSYATPIINHPEVAILGMYKITKKPVWNGSTFVPVDTMNITVTADHRLIDGAVAANFLKSFIGKLENPGLLILNLA